MDELSKGVTISMAKLNSDTDKDELYLHYYVSPKGKLKHVLLAFQFSHASKLHPDIV